MQEKRLGRGLDYLLSLSTQESSEEQKVEALKIANIRKNRFQPRKSMDQGSLDELTASIKENGVLQPILVRRSGNHYELIAGERRLRACTNLNEETIPAIVLDIPDDKLLQFAIIENLQRDDLNPMDEAKAYQAMLKLESITHEDLAKRIGKKRPTISNALRLLELPAETQEYVSRGTISSGHARALLGMTSKDEILSLSRRIVTEGLSVRDVESIVKSSKNKEEKPKQKTKPSADSNIKSYENLLKDKYNTKVKIHSKGESGSITFNFYSKDDFSRLLSMFVK